MLNDRKFQFQDKLFRYKDSHYKDKILIIWYEYCKIEHFYQKIFS